MIGATGAVMMGAEIVLITGIGAALIKLAVEMAGAEYIIGAEYPRNRIDGVSDRSL